MADRFRRRFNGDRERLSELVDLVTPVLWNAARSQGANPPTCEDAIQTAWLQLVDWARTTFRQEALCVKVAGIPEVHGAP